MSDDVYTLHINIKDTESFATEEDRQRAMLGLIDKEKKLAETICEIMSFPTNCRQHDLFKLIECKYSEWCILLKGADVDKITNSIDRLLLECNDLDILVSNYINHIEQWGSPIFRSSKKTRFIYSPESSDLPTKKHQINPRSGYVGQFVAECLDSKANSGFTCIRI